MCILCVSQKKEKKDQLIYQNIAIRWIPYWSGSYTDDVNYIIMTRTKWTLDTVSRNSAKHLLWTKTIYATYSNPDLTAVRKQKPGINNLSLSKKEKCLQDSENMMQLVSLQPLCVPNTRQHKNCVCLYARVCVPSIHIATLYLANWYFCSGTWKGKLYNQGLGIHRHRHPHSSWNNYYVVEGVYISRGGEQQCAMSTTLLCSVCWF